MPDSASDETGETPSKVARLSRSQTPCGTTDATTLEADEPIGRGGVMAGRPGGVMAAASSKLFTKKEETVVKKER